MGVSGQTFVGSVGIYGTYDISIQGHALINYIISVNKLNGLAGYTAASQLCNYNYSAK